MTTQQAAQGNRTRRGGRLNPFMQAASILTSVVLYLALFVSPLVASTNFSLTRFRNYFQPDQYAYLAIASNVRDGDYANVEPFTETGSSYYPRLYYVLLGSLARLFDADLVATWQVAGVALQVLMVAAVSALCIRVTRVPWTGVLGILPFLLGTFAWLEGDTWYRTLESHGVIWASYGVLFTLNGEAAALCMTVMAMAGVVIVTQGSTRPVPRRLVLIAAFAVVGVTANVHTYSFLASVYLITFVLGAYGIVAARAWKAAALSLLLTLAVIAFGPNLADTGGPLVTLVAGAVGTVPGLLLLARRHAADFILSALAFTVLAAPTIAGTLFGVLSGDPFLTYREASSSELGVPALTGAAAAALPGVILVVLMAGGIAARNTLWISLPIGAAAAWAMASSNDVWGANQEPYRFWINSFTLVSALALPLCAGAVAHLFNPGRRRGQRRTEKNSPTKSLAAGRPRLVTAAATLAVIALVGVSLPDYLRFSEDVRERGTVEIMSGQMNSAAEVTSNIEPLRGDERGRGLLAFDPCIDPLLLKQATRLPVAYYNLGLAWPADEPAVREVLRERGNGTFDSADATAAGIVYILTDSTCTSDWSTSIRGSVVATASYLSSAGPAEITLWRLED